MTVPTTMRAIAFYQHGGLDVLQNVELPVPTIAPDQVLVRIHYTALNHLDLFVREGWKGLTLKLPHVPGADFSGEIAQIGERVQGWQVGQRVVANPGIFDPAAGMDEPGLYANYHILGEHESGAYAEYLAMPARNLIAVPEGYDMTAAAAAPLVFLTAWRMLITRANLRAGESVLVVGAGGGVNTAAIQIACLAGARVYAVTSSEEKVARAKELGADVVVDRTREDWGKAIFNATGRRGVDVVVDNVGKATWMSSIRAVARGGRLVVVGNTSGPIAETDIRYLFQKQISLIGSTMGTQQDFEMVMRLVFAGKLKPVVDSVIPLAEARAAQERLEKAEQFGKVVLKVIE